MLLSLNIIAKLGKEIQSSTPPSLRTPIETSGVPRATLTFGNLLKDSLNTLRAAILTLIAYQREGYRLKSAKERNAYNRVQETPHMELPVLFSLWNHG